MKNAETPTTTYTDGKFRRTALIIGPENAGSVDVVTAEGERLAQLNLFITEDGVFMADVIDVDERYKTHLALGFPEGRRTVTKAGTVVGAHFTNEETS